MEENFHTKCSNLNVNQYFVRFCKYKVIFANFMNSCHKYKLLALLIYRSTNNQRSSFLFISDQKILEHQTALFNSETIFAHISYAHVCSFFSTYKSLTRQIYANVYLLYISEKCQKNRFFLVINSLLIFCISLQEINLYTHSVIITYVERTNTYNNVTYVIVTKRRLANKTMEYISILFDKLFILDIRIFYIWNNFYVYLCPL